MSALQVETVTFVHHWTERLFSFRTTRHPGFRYLNGQFVMIGLRISGKPLLRAYSLVSPNYEDELEFLSIKVPDGPLTSHLQHLKVGETILVGAKATGTLLADNLLPGRNLYLISTGTGLAPFMSLIRDPEIYERFGKVVLVHGVRQRAELAYADLIRNELPAHELIGDMVASQLLYYPTVTREASAHQGRVTELAASGKLFSDLALPRWDASQDRVMLCGSPQMLADMVTQLEGAGFSEGSSGRPGSYVIEKAFVER